MHDMAQCNTRFDIEIKKDGAMWLCGLLTEPAKRKQLARQESATQFGVFLYFFSI